MHSKLLKLYLFPLTRPALFFTTNTTTVTSTIIAITTTIITVTALVTFSGGGSKSRRVYYRRWWVVWRPQRTPVPVHARTTATALATTVGVIDLVMTILKTMILPRDTSC
jgi:hypothetical protein